MLSICLQSKNMRMARLICGALISVRASASAQALESLRCSNHGLGKATTRGMKISVARGQWKLLDKAGTYFYNKDDSTVYSGGRVVGRFSYAPTLFDAFPDDSGGELPIPSISITQSEIIAEIKKASNEGAYFVLPSQLNGAEYPSFQSIVKSIDEYRFDNTGGPRGQLAVHPAAGQFVLDNAACDYRPEGINAIDQILTHLNEAGFPFRLQNGYLEVPELDNASSYESAQKVFQEKLHTLRPLVMEDVEASGTRPSLTGLTAENHRVNLVYASAVPVNTYNNRAQTQAHLQFMHSIASKILVAQYYVALKHAALRDSSIDGGGKRRVYLMPLGGGVFNNPRDLIAEAMSRAVEMLTEGERDTLDIRLLAYGDATRKAFAAHLRNLRKLRDHEESDIGVS